MLSSRYETLYLKTKELSEKFLDREPERSDDSKEDDERCMRMNMCYNNVKKARIAPIAHDACAQLTASAKTTL
jgi:hypothetical protein